MFPRAAVALSVAALAAVGPARAIDRFEIQVYDSDIDAPGEVSLEAHLNFSAQGTRTPEYPGQVPPYHVGRITLEPAVGLTEWLELGTYLQFLWAPGGDARFAGWKGRLKLVVPERAGLPIMLGLNVEVARVPYSVEQALWAMEFRPIIGWRGERWLVSVNPIFGWALSGSDRFRADLEPCAKVSFDTRLGFAIGTEYYSSLGFANAFLPAGDQEHFLFATIDLVPAPEHAAPQAGSIARSSPWELNVGVGGALTSAPGPHVIVKAIVGRSF